MEDVIKYLVRATTAKVLIGIKAGAVEVRFRFEGLGHKGFGLCAVPLGNKNCSVKVKL